jgi:hypothetical protein
MTSNAPKYLNGGLLLKIFTLFKKTRSNVVVVEMMMQTAMIENKAWCFVVFDNTVTHTTPITETATMLYIANAISFESVFTLIFACLVCHAKKIPKSNSKPL